MKGEKNEFYLIYRDSFLVGPFDTPGLAIRYFEENRDPDYPEGTDINEKQLEGKEICLGRVFLPRVVMRESEGSDEKG